MGTFLWLKLNVYCISEYLRQVMNTYRAPAFSVIALNAEFRQVSTLSFMFMKLFQPDTTETNNLLPVCNGNEWTSFLSC